MNRSDLEFKQEVKSDVDTSQQASSRAVLRAHVLVDRELRVIAIDADADVLLCTPGSELSIGGGLLLAECPKWRQELECLIHDHESAAPRQAALTTPRATLRVEVRSLRKAAHPYAAQFRLIVVRTNTLAADLGNIVHSFRLSEAEAKILDALCSGMNPSDIAKRRPLSIHTVRTQVKTVLAKLGVHSQIEAVRLVYQTYLEERLAA